MLDEDYSENKTLVLSSLEGIGSVFDLQVSFRIHDFLTLTTSRPHLGMTSAGCSSEKASLIRYPPLCWLYCGIRPCRMKGLVPEQSKCCCSSVRWRRRTGE
jgi:hypothetical protein